MFKKTPVPKKPGRPRQWAEDMIARFPAGTFKRIAAAVRNGETKTDLVREAVERELKRREQRKKTRPKLLDLH